MLASFAEIGKMLAIAANHSSLEDAERPGMHSHAERGNEKITRDSNLPHLAAAEQNLRQILVPQHPLT